MVSKQQNKAKRFQHQCDSGWRLGSGVSVCKAGVCRWHFTGLVPALLSTSGKTRLGGFTAFCTSVHPVCMWSVSPWQSAVLPSPVVAAADLRHKHNCYADVISSWVAAHDN